MKVLIVGLGSIGKRHFDNFTKLGCEVAVQSRRELPGYVFFNHLDEAMSSFQPSYVVIASETSEHGPVLNKILDYSVVKKVLVEKPLYAQLPESKPVRNTDVSVAYNLRFHPLVIKLKDSLKGKRILNWHSYVGQYLPGWRPGRNYKEVYSSSKSAGGGVLRDLSHEIDLFRYFAGDFKLKSALGGHISNLETDVDDAFSLLLTGSSCSHGNIHMNCLDRLVQRFITVTTEEETFYLDLIQGRWKDSKSDQVLDFDRNSSYLEMARAFIENDERLCSFQEGWDTNRIIHEAEAYI